MQRAKKKSRHDGKSGEAWNCLASLAAPSSGSAKFARIHRCISSCCARSRAEIGSGTRGNALCGNANESMERMCLPISSLFEGTGDARELSEVEFVQVVRQKAGQPTCPLSKVAVALVMWGSQRDTNDVDRPTNHVSV